MLSALAEVDGRQSAGAAAQKPGMDPGALHSLIKGPVERKLIKADEEAQCGRRSGYVHGQ